MALSIPVTWSETYRVHAPATGHHVTRSAFGGSCYLNNAAVTAQHLVARGTSRADESGATNLNVTLASGSGDEAWLAGLDLLVDAARDHGSDALVVALGVDAGTDDPNSPLAVTEARFREAGRRLGALGLPTVLVREGGYVLETVGQLVGAVLEGFEEAR